MEKRPNDFNSCLALYAFVLLLLWIAGSVISNIVNYRPVDQAQKNMIAKIQKAHLLGAKKQNVIAFFKQQKLPYNKYYGVMGGDGWEAFLNNKAPASPLGEIIEGGTDVIAQTLGFLGCQKSWSLDTRAMFDAKGRVVEVEVRPTFYGCDI